MTTPTLRAACERLLSNYDLTGHHEPVQELAKDIEALRAALAEDGVRRHMEAEARLGSWPDAAKTPAALAEAEESARMGREAERFMRGEQPPAPFWTNPKGSTCPRCGQTHLHYHEGPVGPLPKDEPRPAPAEDQQSQDQAAMLAASMRRSAPAEAAEPVAWAMEGELGGLTLFCDRPTLIEKSIGRAAIPLYRRPPASAPAREIKRRKPNPPPIDPDVEHLSMLEEVADAADAMVRGMVMDKPLPGGNAAAAYVTPSAVAHLKAQLDRLRAGKEAT